MCLCMTSFTFHNQPASQVESLSGTREKRYKLRRKIRKRGVEGVEVVPRATVNLTLGGTLQKRLKSI